MTATVIEDRRRDAADVEGDDLRRSLGEEADRVRRADVTRGECRRTYAEMKRLGAALVEAHRRWSRARSAHSAAMAEARALAMATDRLVALSVDIENAERRERENAVKYARFALSGEGVETDSGVLLEPDALEGDAATMADALECALRVREVYALEVATAAGLIENTTDGGADVGAAARGHSKDGDGNHDR